jgi:hypothetical protein
VVSGVTGTTEANGTWTVAVVDNNDISLIGSTFVNAYVSGGYGGVRGKDSDLCMEGTSPGNKANQLTLDNVTYASSSALGQSPAPAYVIESTTQGGSNGDYIGFFGSSAIKAGTANVNIGYNSFTIALENWVNAAPTHYVRNLIGLPKVDTADSTFSISTTGALGAGTTTPATGLAFDMTSDTLGAFGLPEWTTSGRPSITGLNGIGFNTTSHAFEGWNGSTWLSLSTSWPTLGTALISGGAGANPTGVPEVDGDCLIGSGGAWTVGSCTGTTDTNSLLRDISASFDGGGNALTAGKIIYLSNVPYTGTITGVTMLADQSCSATVDVWKVAYASAPPTVANTITAADLPTLSSAQKSNDTTLTGWTKSVTAGDTMAFKLVTSATCQFINVSLQVTAN